MFAITSSFGDPWLLIVLYGIAYWMALMSILKNEHVDTLEKILWVLVISIAPIIGLVAFWYLDPLPNTQRSSKSDSLSDLAGTPWEKDSGHEFDKK
jgi:hypothetical protein